MQWFIHCWLCVQQFSFKRRTSTHTHAYTSTHTHTHSDNRLTYAGIKTNLLIDIDWGGQVACCLPAPLLVPPAACCHCQLRQSRKTGRTTMATHTYIHAHTHNNWCLTIDISQKTRAPESPREQSATNATRFICFNFATGQPCPLTHYPFIPRPTVGTVTVTVGLNVSCSCCRLAPPTISVSVAIVGGIAIVCAPMAKNLN